MAKQPFRSIGLRVRDFARTRIRSYISSGDTVSRSELSLPPSWGDDVHEPLVWSEDAAPSAPGAPVDAQEYQPEPEYEAPRYATPTPGAVTHGMLERLLAAHEERMAQEEAGKAAENVNAPASASNSESPSPTIQRQAEGDDSGGAPPRVMTRRRRGAVIDVPIQRAPSSEEDTPDEDASPDFFFLNDAASQPETVQRAADVTPVPPARPETIQRAAEASAQTQPDSSSASSPGTSFWRRLFSRGDDTPNVQTKADEDSSAFPVDTTSDEYPGDQQLSSAETPSFTPTHSPTPQRAPESRSVDKPSIQRVSDEVPSESPTILTPVDMPFSNVTPSFHAKPDAPEETASTPAASPAPSSTRMPANAAPAVQRSARREPDQPVAPSEPNTSAEAAFPPAPAADEFTSQPNSPIQSNTSRAQPTISSQKAAQKAASKAQRKARRQAEQDTPPTAPTGSQYSPAQPITNAPEQSVSTSTSSQPETAIPYGVDTPMTFTPTAQASAQRETGDSSPAPAPAQPPRRGLFRRNRQPQSDVQRQESETAQAADVPAFPETTHQSQESSPAPDTAPNVSQIDATPASRPSSERSVQRKTEPQSQNAPTISRQTDHQSSSSVQRRSAGNEDFPIVPLREPPAPTAAPQISGEPPRPYSPAVQRRTDADNADSVPSTYSSSQDVQNSPAREVVQRSPAQQPPVESQIAPDAPSAFEPPAPQPGSQSPPSATPTVQREASGKSSKRQPARRVQRKTSQHSSVEQPFETTFEQASDVPASDPAAYTTPPAQSRAQTTPAPLQRAADADQVETPQAAASHADSEPLDAPTLLTPAAPSPSSGVQRSFYQPEPYTPDAPTSYTPTPQHDAPPVQRESDHQASEAAPQAPSHRQEVKQPPKPQSPWGAFIRPRESHQNVSPSEPTVQRQLANTNPSQNPPLGRGQETDSITPTDTEEPAHEQSIDLFTALLDAGMIDAPPRRASGAQPQIARRVGSETASHTERSTQPPDSHIAPSTHDSWSPVSDTSASDAELLSLIDLPPTTPVIRQANSSSIVSREVTPAPPQSKSTQPALHSQPPTIEAYSDDNDSLMRAEASPSRGASASSSGEGSDESGEPQEDVNVDKLARDVLSVLRQRLRIEQERRGGRP